MSDKPKWIADAEARERRDEERRTVTDACDSGQAPLTHALLAEQAKELPELPCCPVHENLLRAGKLKPFDNCVVCIRNERDELRAQRDAVVILLRAKTDDATWAKYPDSLKDAVDTEYGQLRAERDRAIQTRNLAQEASSRDVLEKQKLRAALLDAKRALLEITDYSSGWRYGQEGMCLLRIDALTRAALSAISKAEGK